MFRKRALMALLGLMIVLGVPSDGRAAEGVPWGTDHAGGFRTAETSLQPALVLFTGDPCGAKAPIGAFEPNESEGRQVAAEAGSRERTHQTDCELLELDVLSKPEFVKAAARYVPLLFNRSGRATAGGAADDDDLQRRYQVRTIPTLLVTDPWGNEIVRLVGRTPVERAVQIVSAMPKDFAPLRAAGEALKRDPQSLPGLLAAASFYEANQLGAISERYYEQAAGAPAARDDTTARSQIVLARGFNLLKIGRAKEALNVYQAEAKRAPEGPQADAILFGWALASLTLGDRGTAERVSKDLAGRFPSSVYTARLKEHLARQP